MSVLLGLLWLFACVAAFVVGFGITGTTGGARSGAPRWQQPGVGAAMVGFSLAMLVFIACALVAAARERRRQLNVRLPSLDMAWYSVIASVVPRPRRLALYLVVLLLIIPLGFWVRHLYG